MIAKSIAFALVLGTVAGPALAAEKSVTLSVPGMTCGSCPFIVESALKKIKGVQSVKTSVPDRTAVVVFDDTLTNIKALTTATKDAGYASSPVKESNS